MCTFQNDEKDDTTSNDESSDDTPLLFDKTPARAENEFDAIQHCHITSQNRKHVSSAKRKLIIASGLCLLFIAGEVTGGYLSGSLAVMSDAAHMFSDFASFLISLFAIHLGSKKSSRRFTFGLYRAEILGALITVMIIWFVTGVLLVSIFFFSSVFIPHAISYHTLLGFSSPSKYFIIS